MQTCRSLSKTKAEIKQKPGITDDHTPPSEFHTLFCSHFLHMFSALLQTLQENCTLSPPFSLEPSSFQPQGLRETAPDKVCQLPIGKTQLQPRSISSSSPRYRDTLANFSETSFLNDFYLDIFCFSTWLPRYHTSLIFLLCPWPLAGPLLSSSP